MVIVNGTASWIMEFLSKRSSFDIATVVVVVMVLCRAVIRIYSFWKS